MAGIYDNIGELTFNDVLTYGAVRGIDSYFGGDVVAPESPNDNAKLVTASHQGGGSIAKDAPTPDTLTDYLRANRTGLIIAGGVLVGALVLMRVMR